MTLPKKDCECCEMFRLVDHAYSDHLKDWGQSLGSVTVELVGSNRSTWQLRSYLFVLYDTFTGSCQAAAVTDQLQVQVELGQGPTGTVTVASAKTLLIIVLRVHKDGDR